MFLRRKQLSEGQMISACSTALGNIQIRNRIVGCQAAVWQNGQLRMQIKCGFKGGSEIVQNDTVFRLASVSKPITAVALMRAVEQRYIGLDQPIREILPANQFEVVPGGAGWAALNTLLGCTPRQILIHTSGIRHYGSLGDQDTTRQYQMAWDALPRFIYDPPVSGCPVPGAGYSYSTHAFTLLAAALERRVGKNFARWAQEELFHSLGLSYELGFENPVRLSLPWGGTTVDQYISNLIDDHRAGRRSAIHRSTGVEDTVRGNLSWKWAGGGMEGTASGLVTFWGRVTNGELLSFNSWGLMKQAQIMPAGSGLQRTLGFEFCPNTGTPINGSPVSTLEHGGSQEGTRSYLVVFPTTPITIVAVLTNTQDASGSSTIYNAVRGVCRQMARIWYTGSLTP